MALNVYMLCDRLLMRLDLAVVSTRDHPWLASCRRSIRKCEVDRGSYGLECVTLLICYKVR